MKALVLITCLLWGIAPARADYLYTVQFDELTIPYFNGTRTYATSDLSFVTPALLGLAPGQIATYDILSPEPVVEGFPIDRVSVFAFSSGQYVLSAQRPGLSFATGDVRSLIWAFQTDSGTEEYGPGTYGASCLLNGLPSNLCFARSLEGLPAGSGRGTGFMSVSVVPLPAATLLFGSALGLIAALRRQPVRQG